MAKGKILIIDDSPLVRKLAEVSLQEAGYEVHTAENGEDGLKIAESIVPDLILVDFIMPVMTGSQFCAILRENEKLKDIPLLLITGKGESVGQTFVEKFGVVDYFIKPFKSEDLVEKVEEILSRYAPLKSKETHFEIEEFEELTIVDQIKEASLAVETPLTIDTALEVEKVEIPSDESLEEVIELRMQEDTSKITDQPIIELKTEEDKATAELVDQIVSEDREIMELSQENLETISEKIELVPLDEEEKIEIKDVYDSIELGVEISPVIKNEEEIEFQEKIDLSYENKKEAEDTKKIQIEPEQKFQAMPVDTQEIERIIDTKIQQFSNKVIPILNLSFETILKKHGLIKNTNILMSGKFEEFLPENLLEFLENIKTNGLLTIFTKEAVFELFMFNGYLVYCISDRTRMRLGDKLLKEIEQPELEAITKSDLQSLRTMEPDCFILEKKELSHNFLQNFKMFKLKELV